MKIRILIISIIIIGLSAGGFFVWKNFFAPKEVYKGAWMFLGSSLIPDSYFPEGFDTSTLEPVFADLDKAQQSGVNALAIFMIHWADEQGELNLLPGTKEFFASFIDEAHARGFTIWLSPDIARPIDKGSKKGPSELRIMPEELLENTDLIKNFEAVIIETAKFAQEHDVEIFSPSCEMYVNIGRERSKRLIAEIKPKVDAVYNGKICLKGEWPKPEFSAYSCFGPPVDIPENEEEKNKLIDNIDFQLSRDDIEVELIIGELWEGNDWRGSQEEAKRGFETALEVVEGKVSGVFILDMGRSTPFFPESFEETVKEFYSNSP